MNGAPATHVPSTAASHSGTGLIWLLLLISLVSGLAACGSLGQHRVQAGETLYAISFRYGQDYHEVAKWNQLRPPYTIYEGQILRVAPTAEAVERSERVATSPPSIVRRESPPPRVAPSPRATPAPNAQPVQWRWPTEGQLVQGYSNNAAGSKGIDIAGNAGQPVRAAASGRVVYAGSGMLHYGNLIIIKHDDTFLSAYAHNRVLRVAEGAEVSGGQTIADMGVKTNGDVLLHFQIRRDGKPVDPLRYLPPLRR